MYHIPLSDMDRRLKEPNALMSGTCIIRDKETFKVFFNTGNKLAKKNGKINVIMGTKNSSDGQKRFLRVKKKTHNSNDELIVDNLGNPNPQYYTILKFGDEEKRMYDVLYTKVVEQFVQHIKFVKNGVKELCEQLNMDPTKLKATNSKFANQFQSFMTKKDPSFVNVCQAFKLSVLDGYLDLDPGELVRHFVYKFKRQGDDDDDDNNKKMEDEDDAPPVYGINIKIVWDVPWVGDDKTGYDPNTKIHKFERFDMHKYTKRAVAKFSRAIGPMVLDRLMKSEFDACFVGSLIGNIQTKTSGPIPFIIQRGKASAFYIYSLEKAKDSDHVISEEPVYNLDFDSNKNEEGDDYNFGKEGQEPPRSNFQPIGNQSSFSGMKRSQHPSDNISDIS